MTATLNGSFDPIRLGPNHQFIGGGWEATLTFDTDFGLASNSAATRGSTGRRLRAAPRP